MGNLTSQALYWKLVAKFIDSAIITQKQAQTIARKGSRKEGYYKRHVIDLCEFALWKMQDLNIQDASLETLCNQAIQLMKRRQDE